MWFQHQIGRRSRLGITPMLISTRLLYHFLPNHREQCIGIVISFQAVNLNSQQAFKGVKHWLKVSEHIFEMLALVGILLVSFCSSHDYQSRCHSTCGQSVILALFFDWEIYFTPEQTFLNQNLCTQSLY